MIISITVLASCGKKDKGDNKDKDNTPSTNYPSIPGADKDGGVETPIVPYQ